MSSSNAAKGAAVRVELAPEPEPLSAQLPVEQYLAAILAHEISNPFTALSGRVDLMRTRKDLPVPYIRDLDAMKNANERIDRILTNLKAFARRETPLARPMDIVAPIEAAVARFAETPRGQRVSVRVESPTPVVKAVIEPTVLMTVVGASLEALSGRAKVIDTMTIRIHVDSGNEEVALVFSDQGPLISEEDVARVFHPFGGPALPSFPGAITLAYGYYMIRGWGGTYRFKHDGRTQSCELCLSQHA